MRSPGAVYRKLKEVKYFHFIDLYKRVMKRVPSNCKYNYQYRVIGDGGIEKEIRLCLLHQPEVDIKNGVFPHLVDICEEAHQVSHCNGFIPKYNKEGVKKLFEEALCNKNIREKKYPDICALEWVLERSVVGVVPLTWIQQLFYKIKKLIRRSSL